MPTGRRKPRRHNQVLGEARPGTYPGRVTPFSGWLAMFQSKALCAAALSIVLATACAPHSYSVSEQHLTPAELRGKIIYTKGRGAAGDPLFYRLLGAGDGLLPARGVVCATCHGPEGKGATQGAREGDIVVADITYATLARPLPVAPPWYRGRDAYNAVTLGRAITQGLDASGNQLDAAMPRWVMSPAELQDLVQYLQRLGRQ